MKRGSFGRALACAALFWAVAAASYAQNPFLAPPSAIDALSAGSPTGGINSSFYLDRARGAAATAAANAPSPAGFPGAPPAPPAPAAPAAPARGGGYAGYNYGYGGYGGAAAAAGPAAPATPTPTPIPTVMVLAGERVYDHNTRELLSDYRYLDVPQNQLEGRYFDDGTHGDEKTGDSLYTNATERDDVIGPATHQILSRLLRALERAEELSPLEFFRLHVLTTETISEIGKWRVEEAERDEKLRDWAVSFVREYKQNPEDPGSPFWPLYVVPPPPAPSTKVGRPVDAWRPPTSPQWKADLAPEGQAARAGYGYGAAVGGAGGGYGYGGGG